MIIIRVWPRREWEWRGRGVCRLQRLVKVLRHKLVTLAVEMNDEEQDDFTHSGMIGPWQTYTLRHRDRQTDGLTNTQTDGQRQTHEQKDTETDREIQRQTDTETDADVLQNHKLIVTIRLYKSFLVKCNNKQEVKVIWQKAPHGGPIPRLGVTTGGRKLYH